MRENDGPMIRSGSLSCEARRSCALSSNFRWRLSSLFDYFEPCQHPDAEVKTAPVGESHDLDDVQNPQIFGQDHPSVCWRNYRILTSFCGNNWEALFFSFILPYPQEQRIGEKQKYLIPNEIINRYFELLIL